MAFIHSPKIVTDGLVLALDAANTKSYVSGSTSLSDLSGNVNTGTIQTPYVYTAVNNGGVNLSGSYVSFTTNDNLRLDRSDFTIISAITITNISNPYITFFYQGSGVGTVANTSFQFGRYINTGSIELNFYGPTATYNFGAGSFTTGSTFITACMFVSSSQSVTFFYNGRFSNSISVGSSFSMPTFDVCQIGRRYAAGPAIKDLEGNLYSTFIYKRALSAAEVQQNYNALKGRFGL